MEFKKKQTIYLQIGDNICEKILLGEFSEKEKIPSIRSLAVDLEVNPNTVQRTYEYLQQSEIIHTQRGLGYFVSEGAIARIKARKKKIFLENELPHLFKSMKLLEIDMATLADKYKVFQNNKN